MTIVKSFDFTLSGSAYGSAIYTNGFPISEIVAPTSASAATALTVQTSLDNVTYSQLLSNGSPYTIPIIAGSASKIPESAFNGIPYLKFAANANVGTSVFSMSYYNNYANDTASISHANLDDLQGGGINELYHLSLSQYNNLSGSGTTTGSYVSKSGDTMSGSLVITTSNSDPSITVNNSSTGSLAKFGNTKIENDGAMVLTSASSLAYKEGKMYWDTTDHTLALMTEKSNTVLQVGQESFVRVVNKSGSLLTDGTTVYLSGAQGNRPTILPASANSDLTSRTIGVVTADIPNNEEGYVTTLGLVRDYNTSSFDAGSPLYLSTTAGSLTQIRPVAPAHSALVAFTLNSTNAGSIFVNPDVGSDLSTLHDVNITNPTNNQVLTYNSSGSYWANSTASSGSHNSLAGIQGGSSNQYYHVDQRQYNLLSGSSGSALVSGCSVYVENNGLFSGILKPLGTSDTNIVTWDCTDTVTNPPVFVGSWGNVQNIGFNVRFSQDYYPNGTYVTITSVFDKISIYVAKDNATQVVVYDNNVLIDTFSTYNPTAPVIKTYNLAYGTHTIKLGKLNDGQNAMGFAKFVTSTTAGQFIRDAQAGFARIDTFATVTSASSGQILVYDASGSTFRNTNTITGSLSGSSALTVNNTGSGSIAKFGGTTNYAVVNNDASMLITGSSTNTMMTVRNNGSGSLAQIGGATNNAIFNNNGFLSFSGSGAGWNDLEGSLQTAIQGATDKPPFDPTTLGYLFPQNDPTAIMYITLQFPHTYLQGSDIFPHVHILQTHTGSPIFTLDYMWTNIGDLTTGSWVQYNMSTPITVPYTSGSMHQIMHNTTPISGSGKRISSIFLAKLYRSNDSYTGVCPTFTFDIHHQIDTPTGSRLSTVK